MSLSGRDRSTRDDFMFSPWESRALAATAEGPGLIA
jgi:hypothetical protein